MSNFVRPIRPATALAAPRYRTDRRTEAQKMNSRSFAASLNWRRSSDRTFCFLGGPAHYKVIGNFRKNKVITHGLNEVKIPFQR
jgi:hypothetical protein